jgi:hypothetical protein
MPESKKTLKILYTGEQPLVFRHIGRVVDHDKAGNVQVKEPGVEIRLLPSAKLPPADQHQPVDADAWAKAKAHKTMGKSIAHLVKRGQLHEFAG